MYSTPSSAYNKILIGKRYTSCLHYVTTILHSSDVPPPTTTYTKPPPLFQTSLLVPPPSIRQPGQKHPSTTSHTDEETYLFRGKTSPLFSFHVDGTTSTSSLQHPEFRVPPDLLRKGHVVAHGRGREVGRHIHPQLRFRKLDGHDLETFLKNDLMFKKGLIAFVCVRLKYGLGGGGFGSNTGRYFRSFY